MDNAEKGPMNEADKEKNKKDTLSTYEHLLKAIVFPSLQRSSRFPHHGPGVVGYPDAYIKSFLVNKIEPEVKRGEISYKEFNAELKSILKAREILAKYSQEAADLFLEKYIAFAVEDMVASRVESIVEAKVEEYLAKKFGSLPSNNK